MSKDSNKTLNELQAWFKQKSVTELTQIIIDSIADSEEQQGKWQLAMLSDQGHLNDSNGVSQITKMISKALPVKSLWDWDKVNVYFDHANNMFDDIFNVIDALPVDKQWRLILDALARLNKVLEQIDDSGDCRFYIEGQLNQKLTDLFNQQAWQNDEKARWIFDHFKEYKYDVFPAVPDDFSLSPEVYQCFLTLCASEAKKRVKNGIDLSQWKEKWALERLIAPLVTQAEQNHDWQEQCRLMNMSAYGTTDFIKISQVCLASFNTTQGDSSAHLDTEHWLQQAYQQAKTPIEKNKCQQFEVQLRIALSEYKMAWQLAWQLFTEQPSFSGYKTLVALQDQTGVIDPDFEVKTEQLLADCYVESTYGISSNADALLAFYLHHQALEKARVWALSHKATPSNLVTLADAIVSQHPQNAVDLYCRVVMPMIAQANNNVYQQATDLLVNLAKQLKSQDMGLLTAMIATIIKQHKAKRNMMKLLKTHFAECFE